MVKIVKVILAEIISTNVYNISVKELFVNKEIMG